MEKEFEELKRWVDAPKNGIVNKDKMQNVMDAFEIIKKIVFASDSDATIEVAEGALQLGSVAIKVTTTDVAVYDTEEFAEATKNAANWQVYPTTDDRIKLDISFDGVIDYTLI